MAVSWTCDYPAQRNKTTEDTLPRRTHMSPRRILIAIITLVLCLAPALSVQAAEEAKTYKIKMATLAPEGSSWMKRFHEASRAIEKKSGGRLKLKIYAGGIMGDEPDVIRKIRIGQLQGAAVTGIGLGIIQPAVRVLDLPFLFKSYEELDYIRETLSSDFEKMFEERGYVLLGWGDVGWIHVFSNQPVTTQDELLATKLWAWVDDPLAHSMFKEVGVKGIPLSLPAVLPHLQTGLINAAYGSPLSTLALQWYTKVKYMSDLPITMANAAVVVSKKSFDALPKDLQVLLKEEGKNMQQMLIDQVRRDNEESLKVLKKYGIKVTNTQPEFLQEMKRAAEAVSNQLAGTLYPPELLAHVKELLEARRNPPTE